MKTLAFISAFLVAGAAHADDITFSQVLEQVITPKCLLCHSNPAKDPKDLTSYEEVMAFVIPGDLANSKLMQKIVAGQMPPPKFLEINPDAALTEDDVALIENWISQGALN